VSIVGSRESDSWEMKILGPNGFERSYILVGGGGEHQASVMANVRFREIRQILYPMKSTDDRPLLVRTKVFPCSTRTDSCWLVQDVY
jgi:hypothetical protein